MAVTSQTRALAQTWTRWRRRVLAAALTCVTACLVAVLFQMGPAIIVLCAVIASTYAAIWLLVDLSAQAQPPYWHGDFHPLPRERGFDPRLSHLRRTVADALDRSGDRRVVPGRDLLHPLLRDLTDERLEARHGVSLAADPDAARRLVGPELADYLQRPPGANERLRPTALSAFLNRIESL